MKKCSICKQIKELSGFNRDKSQKDGLSYTCRLCVKKYKQAHKNESRAYIKLYCKNHKERLLKYRNEHREERKQYQKQWKKLNKAIVIAKAKIYRKTHKKYRNKQLRERRVKDIQFKILRDLRTRIGKVIKNNTKTKSTKILIGCSIDKIRKHLELQFKDGMSWNNHGRGFNGKGMKEWHIDHIKPCDSFDLSKSEEQCKCFHYSNLQPLWAKENWSKGNKY